MTGTVHANIGIAIRDMKQHSLLHDTTGPTAKPSDDSARRSQSLSLLCVSSGRNQGRRAESAKRNRAPHRIDTQAGRGRLKKENRHRLTCLERLFRRHDDGYATLCFGQVCN